MNQNIQVISDKVADNITAKAIVSPDPARVSAVDHAEILNDILDVLDPLVSANVPAVAGRVWYTPPGTPTISGPTISETASIVNDNTVLWNIPASPSPISVPYAASGKKRIDAVQAHYDIESAYYYIITGTEVDDTEIALTPTISPSDMFVRWLLVTDGAIDQEASGPVKSVSINAGPDQFPDPTGKLELTINTLDGKLQNSLAYDGTGTKVPTVDAVNSALTRNTKLFGYTGITHKNDTVELIPFSSTTIRIAAVTSALFWNELFVSGQVTDNAFKSFPQKDYLLSQLGTATGGNVNQNPITTDGIYVRYLGYDKNGNVVSSAANFLQDLSVVQLGFATVLRSGGVITFLGGTTVGARNVFSQPILANSLELDRTLVSLKSDIVIGFNTGAASLKSSNGSITGLSINWRSTGNPTNALPVDKVSYTGLSTLPFASINPLFLTQTTAPTAHTLWTETEGGIAINNSIYNTTTGARATLDNNKFSVKRVLVGTRGGMWLQDGEHAGTAGYASIDAAKAALSSHVFTESIVPPGIVTEIARIAFKKGVTDFTDAAQFYITSTFNGAGGGGSGSSTTSFAAITGVPSDNAALATDLGNKADKALTINTQTASYTLALTDAAGMVRMNVASANTLTIPPNSSVAFPVGTQLVLAQAGAGQTTIVAGSGVTINSSGGKLKLTGQYSGATLIQVASNNWSLFGDITT